jgi:inner membrane protein involved in colicin E2 resistance
VKDISISQNYLASIASVPVRTELKKKKKEKKSTMKEKNLLQVVPEVVAHSLPAKERYDPKKELVPNYLYCLYFIFACIGLYFV